MSIYNQTAADMCNIALGLLGVEDQVFNIDDPDPENVWEGRAKMIYNPTLRKTLASFMPAFAITPDPVKITRNTKGQHKTPADCLKLLSVDGMSGDDIHEYGGVIHCDFPVGETIEITYIRMVDETGCWSPEFQFYFPYELAVGFAGFLNDKGKRSEAIALKNAALADMGGVNAQRVRLKRRYKDIFKKKWHFPVR